MRAMKIRAARPDEADLLTDLCMRSKASWGYDDAFMAASREVLTLTPQRIAGGHVWVAEEAGGAILGVTAIVPDGADQELDLLFVDPTAHRGGVGRFLLLHAVEQARLAGAKELLIAADVNAAGFYERCGAVRIGEIPSDAIPGRMLPVLSITL